MPLIQLYILASVPVIDLFEYDPSIRFIEVLERGDKLGSHLREFHLWDDSARVAALDCGSEVSVGNDPSSVDEDPVAGLEPADVLEVYSWRLDVPERKVLGDGTRGRAAVVHAGYEERGEF